MTLIAVSAFLLSACSTAPPRPYDLKMGNYAPTREYITKLIQGEMAANNVVGAAIALVDEQQVVWTEGFGFVDKKAGAQATPDSPFRLGSIAKVMTATLAMQLAERKELALDQPFSDFLPEFSIQSRFKSTKAITPRNILSHHSGLPSNRLGGMLSARPTKIASLIPAMREEYVAYPPEYVFSYSNLGVTLLGAAIEKHADQPFETLMQDRLFKPLGMNDTEINGRPEINEYQYGQLAASISLRDIPSGGLVSTANDMGRYMRMLLADGQLDGVRILHKENLAEMWRVQNASNPLDLGFKVGLAWMLSGIDIEAPGPIASHGGMLMDSYSMMIVLPEAKLGVIVMANSAESMNLVRKIATETLKLALETKTGVVYSAATRCSSEDELPAHSKQKTNHFAAQRAAFDTLVGLAKIRGDAQSLDAEVMGHTLELKPSKDGQFALRYKLFGLIPISLSALDDVRLSTQRIEGHEVLIGHFGSQTRLLGERLRPSPIPPIFLDNLGDYEVVGEVGDLSPTRVTMLLDDGLLVGEADFKQFPGMTLRTALQPISENELLVAGLGSGKGETIRIEEKDGERHLLFSGIELKRKADNNTNRRALKKVPIQAAPSASTIQRPDRVALSPQLKDNDQPTKPQ